MTEESYVKISTSSEGDCLIEVQRPNVAEAIESYAATLKALKEEGLTVANTKENEVKCSNDNTKFQPTVTVKGRGETVVQDYKANLSWTAGEEPKK